MGVLSEMCFKDRFNGCISHPLVLHFMVDAIFKGALKVLSRRLKSTSYKAP